MKYCQREFYVITYQCIYHIIQLHCTKLLMIEFFKKILYSTPLLCNIAITVPLIQYRVTFPPTYPTSFKIEVTTECSIFKLCAVNLISHRAVTF